MKALLYTNRVGMLRLAGFLTVYPIFFNALYGYPSYHAPAPATDDTGYCSDCHPGFKGGRNDTLHSLHTGNPDPVTNNCNLCHNGPGSNNPMTMWSYGDSGNGLGCAGCHGRDYGMTITTSTEYSSGDSISGLPKNSGVGLRQHHAQHGITICLGCHYDDPDPYPENVIDPGLGNTTHYYLRDDVRLGGSPVDPSINEDTGNDGDSTGLDNDGDDLYDAADPDSILDPDQVLITTLPGGGLQLSWPTPSPLYYAQTNPTLDAGTWLDLPALSFTDRSNGFWILTIDPPLDTRQFYRLNSAPAALNASTSNARTTAKGGSKPVR